MHEAVMAQSLLATILEEVEKQDAKPIAATISCGILNAVNDEILRFAFDAIAAATPCEGMKLNIEHKPVQGACRACGRRFDVEISSMKCPACGGNDFELLPDAPLMLEEIEFE